MKIANFLLVLLSTYSLLCMAQSGIYKHVNLDGQTLYSNTKMRGANEIDLPEIIVLPASRYSPVNLAIKKGASLHEPNKTTDKKSNQEVKQASMPETAHQDSSDKNVSQLSNQERLHQIIEEIALYEESIEALEVELYNLKQEY
jgi:hypothetical protein